MSLRSFVDSAGNEWQVFDVIPRTEERRRGDRRRYPRSDVQATLERRQEERRVTVGAPARLAHASDGWLCFEHGQDRRRLSPIPADWNRCSDAALEGYCLIAKPAGRVMRRTEMQSAATTRRR
jgi:hypothetical protein